MRKLWASIPLLCSFVALPGMAQDDAQTRAELEAVNAAIASIESWLDRANASHSDAQETLREAELAVSELQGEIAANRQRIQLSREEQERLESQRQTIDADRQAQAEVLANILRAAYQTGEHNRLRLLLSGEDTSKAARMLRYASDLSRYQLERITEFQNTLEQLAEVQQQLDANLAELQQQEADLTQRSAELAAARDERATALAALDADINSRNQELEQLQFDQAELQALLDEIARAMQGVRSFADVPAITGSRGRLSRPVDGAITAQFGSEYGGGSLRRQGIIIRAAEGSPVQAIHPGQVVFADWLRGAGLLVIVDHGNGYMTLYGGNEALSKRAGDWVDTGDVLATSGLGGENGSAGLYFEIRRNGTALNPAEWLAGY